MKTFSNFGHRRDSGDGRTAAVLVLTLAVGIATVAPTSVAASFAEQVADTFKNGEFDVNFRYRYEFVDQDSNGRRDANASTLRTRFVYKTAKWNDFDVTINMDDLRPIVASNFNDTRNGKTQYQTVADPQGTDLNIAAVTYSGLKNTQIIIGRQRITRGDHRFIGNVGWRQNEQTYDALSANYRDDEFTASYAYIDGVKRIFGPEDGAPAASLQSNSHLLDAAYVLNDALSVSVYAYLLDFKNAPGVSSRTFGIRFAGMPKINDDWAVTYAAEFASQQDYKDNPANYDANYLRVELGFKWDRYSVKAGYELLDGSGQPGQSFQTPLATLHAMNGWDDKFLSTPAGGLEDVSITASARVSKGSLSLTLHDFSADTGGTDYGNEIDFVAKWPLGKHYSVLGKFALYNADVSAGNPATGNLGQDTSKAWLQLMASF